MLTNTQFQYIAYGVMVIVVLILIMNVFITKVSNNYNNNTFETFGNIKEGKENNEEEKKINDFNTYLTKKINDICKSKNSYNSKTTNDLINELNKFKTIHGIDGTNQLFDIYINNKNFSLNDKSSKSNEYKNFKYNIEMINNIDKLIDSLKAFDFDCNDYINISKLNNKDTNKEK